MRQWLDSIGDTKSDLDQDIAKSVDQIAKLLELKPEEVYRMPIPLVNSMVAARISNLKEARYRAEKDGEINAYTEKDYYGSKGLVSIINQLFSGSDKEDKPKGAQNMSAMNR